MAVSSAVEEEPMPEGDVAGYPTEGLAPAEELEPELQVTLPVAPKFYAMGPSGEVGMGCGQAGPTCM